MNGKKAKKLRRLAEAVTAGEPEHEMVKVNGHPTRYSNGISGGTVKHHPLSFRGATRGLKKATEKQSLQQVIASTRKGVVNG